MQTKGNNLIFLISQPRSGSTMTQRILGSHSLIHTQSEPWVLLHPLHALRDNNIVAGYNSNLYVKALNDFIDKIPGKKAKYEESIAQTYLDFYHLILKNNNKQFFLDKTPRYYYVIDELLNYFPGSKIIILWRNPAAVLSSIVKSWINNDWQRLSEYKDDLQLAPKLMIEAQTKHKKQVYALKYEDLLAHPNDQISSLCKFLEINFEEGMLQYGNIVNEKWRYGDQETVYNRKQPDIAFAERWQEELKTPQIWRIISDYLNSLGEETLHKMGYAYDHLLDVLQKNKPDHNLEAETIGLKKFLDNEQGVILEKNRLQALLSRTYASVNQKTNELTQLSGELERIKNTVHKKEHLLKDKDATIKEQQALIEKKERELKKAKDQEKILKNSIAENRVILKEQQGLIEKKDTELKIIRGREINLKNTIGENRKTLNEQRALIDTKLAELEEAKNREIELKNSIARNRKTLNEQRALIDRKLAELEEAKNREIDLKNSIAESRKTLNEQRALIDKRNNESALMKKLETALKYTIEQKEATILEQRDLIHKRDDFVQNLTLQIKKNNEIIRSQEHDMVEKKKIIGQLEAELKESASSISQMKEIITLKDSEIKEKEAFLEQVINSHSFRLGSFLLKPAKLIKQFTKTDH